MCWIEKRQWACKYLSNKKLNENRNNAQSMPHISVKKMNNKNVYGEDIFAPVFAPLAHECTRTPIKRKKTQNSIFTFSCAVRKNVI